MKDRSSLVGLAGALVAAAALATAGPASALGWWPFRTGFMVMRCAAWLGAAAAALSIAGGLRGGREDRRAALLGAVIGLAVFAMPWLQLRSAKAAAMIHDITTDTDDPPLFVKMLPLRKDAPNTADYGGPEVAAKQKAAYPDLAPLELALSPAQAFEKAMAAARGMGWEIVDSSPAEGRIEATATTFWFRFKDDVVVRVAASGYGSRIDVRSVSRVGKGDVGTNARRIRAYLDRLSRGA